MARRCSPKHEIAECTCDKRRGAHARSHSPRLARQEGLAWSTGKRPATRTRGSAAHPSGTPCYKLKPGSMLCAVIHGALDACNAAQRAACMSLRTNRNKTGRVDRKRARAAPRNGGTRLSDIACEHVHKHRCARLQRLRSAELSRAVRMNDGQQAQRDNEQQQLLLQRRLHVSLAGKC